MKIALLASTFLPRLGGAEVVVHNLAANFRDLGHDVTVITWWGLWRGCRGQLPYRVLPLLPGSFTLQDRQRWCDGKGTRFKVEWQIAAYQRLIRFDIWNVHMAFPASLFAVPTLNRIGVPVVSTCHGDDIFVDPDRKYGVRLYPPVDAALREALSRSDGTTAISNAMAAEMIGIGCSKDRLTLIPNGVDARRISHWPVHRLAVRRGLGIPEGVPVMISVGRNHPIKGYRNIPLVARLLKAKGHDFRWLVVGDESQTLAPLVEEEGVSENVLLAPGISTDPRLSAGYHMPPDRLMELYRSSDIYVSTSYAEAFPLTWIEAMAAGLPVVAGDVMKSNDIVNDGHNGILAPKGDPVALANILSRLLHHPAERHRLALNAASDAQVFDWTSIANRYLAAYGVVMGRGRVN